MRYLTTGDLAEAFGTMSRTVCKWADTGLLPHHRLPGSMDRRFALRDVQEFARKYDLPLEGMEALRPALLLYTTDRALYLRLEVALGAELPIHLATNLFDLGRLVERRAWDVACLDGAAGEVRSLLAWLPEAMPGVRLVVLDTEDGALGDVDGCLVWPVDVEVLAKVLCREAEAAAKSRPGLRTGRKTRKEPPHA